MSERTYSEYGWFSPNDDPLPVLIHAEHTDRDEVMVDVRALADWVSEQPRASVHLPAADALLLASQLERAARAAISGTPK